jgi:methionine-rich copper-binding protein CopC
MKLNMKTLGDVPKKGAPAERPQRGGLRGGFALFFALCLCGVASGHAFLDKAEPRVGSKISASPGEVKIWFTQELEPAFSSIKVMDENGKEVDKKDTHQDDKDKKLLKVSVSSLSPGGYKVVWQVVSVDTHRTKGDFKFTIKP